MRAELAQLRPANVKYELQPDAAVILQRLPMTRTDAIALRQLKREGPQGFAEDFSRVSKRIRPNGSGAEQESAKALQRGGFDNTQALEIAVPTAMDPTNAFAAELSSLFGL